jgi:hypothetical protein
MQLKQRANLRNDCRLFRGLLFGISLLLFGFAGRCTQAASPKNLHALSIGPGSQFAIADFDGDHRPDLASIEAGTTTASSANYCIRLQLSSSERSSIQVVGPAGGLVIEARDVNGDHAIDLILATALFRQPVAILLNDGHGGFSRAEPNRFPNAFGDAKARWLSSLNLAADTIGIAIQSGTGLCAEEVDAFHGGPVAKLLPTSSVGFSISSFLLSQAGRAPPSVISCL